MIRLRKNNLIKKLIKVASLLGKFTFRNHDEVKNMEKFIQEGIEALIPLYEKLS